MTTERVNALLIRLADFDGQAEELKDRSLAELEAERVVTEDDLAHLSEAFPGSFAVEFIERWLETLREAIRRCA